METQELYTPAFAALVEEERRLAAVCAAVTSGTDHRELARARVELVALRDVMGAFSDAEKIDPAAVREAERERHRARYVALAEEEERKAEGYAAELEKVRVRLAATEREIGQPAPSGYPSSRVEQHFTSLNHRRADLQEEIARLESWIRAAGEKRARHLEDSDPDVVARRKRAELEGKIAALREEVAGHERAVEREAAWVCPETPGELAGQHIRDGWRRMQHDQHEQRSSALPGVLAEARRRLASAERQLREFGGGGE